MAKQKPTSIIIVMSFLILILIVGIGYIIYISRQENPGPCSITTCETSSPTSNNSCNLISFDNMSSSSYTNFYFPLTDTSDLVMDFGEVSISTDLSTSLIEIKYNTTFSEIPYVFISILNPTNLLIRRHTADLGRDLSKFSITYGGIIDTNATITSEYKLQWVAFGKIYDPNRKLIRVSNKFPIYSLQQGIILDFGLTSDQTTPPSFSQESSMTPLVFATPMCSQNQVVNIASITNSSFNYRVDHITSGCKIFWMAILKTISPLNTSLLGASNTYYPVGTTKQDCFLNLNYISPDFYIDLAQYIFVNNIFGRKNYQGIIATTDCTSNVNVGFTYNKLSDFRFQFFVNSGFGVPCHIRYLAVAYSS